MKKKEEGTSAGCLARLLFNLPGLKLPGKHTPEQFCSEQFCCCQNHQPLLAISQQDIRCQIDELGPGTSDIWEGVGTAGGWEEKIGMRPFGEKAGLKKMAAGQGLNSKWGA